MDKITRGKTRAGRLDALDRVVLRWLDEGAFFEEPGGKYVDLGFGASAVTALAMFERIRQMDAQANCTGMDVDAMRVEEAWRECEALKCNEYKWLQGGFAEVGDGDVRLCRAMNVLRQYGVEEAVRAHAQMVRGLCEGGVLIEGSCDRKGERLGAHVVERRGGEGFRRGVFLMCQQGLDGGFAPRMMRDWLPQDLRRGAGRGHQVFVEFLDVWMASFLECGGVRDRDERFARSVELLAERCEGVEYCEWMVQEGVVWWSPEGGVSGVM